MKIIIRNNDGKVVWQKDFEILDEQNIDVLIEEIEKTISIIQRFDEMKKSELKKEAKKELTGGSK
jgi:superfamily I DNA/RNA helicase